MQATTQTKSPTPSAPKRTALNGVDTEALFATINAVKGQPELAAFTFRASNTWIRGTHSRTTMETFTGAGGDHQHIDSYTVDGDHPTVLCGADQAPTPVELLLAGLVGCLTAGIGNIAAARGVELESVESRVEGDLDMRGLLGLDDEVRNGYSGIRVHFEIKSDAPADKVAEVVEQSKNRSAVFDVITNQVPVTVDVQVA